MKILDKLKNLFRKNKPVQLKDGYFEKDKTKPIITIDEIELIINDKNIYKSFNKNEKIFNGNINKTDYIKAIYDYTNFMQSQGKQFSKQVLKRINKITNCKFKNTIDNHKLLGDLKDKQPTIQDIALSIIRNEDEFNNFISMSDNNQTIYGLSKSDIETYIIQNLKSYFSEELNPNSYIRLNEKSKDKLRIINELYDLRSKSYTINPHEYKEIDYDFERKVMRGIPSKADNREIIEKIYCNLNKLLQYDQYFYSTNQDLSEDFIQKIYNKNVNESAKDKTITCKSWSELYAYYLKKNGIDSYINSDGMHKWVSIIDGCNIITADATNLTTSEFDETRMCDLTRAKLGIKPAGLKIKNLKDNKQEVINISSQKSFEIDKNTLHKVSELIALIDDGRSYESELYEEQTKDVLKKLKFISDLSKNGNLTGIEKIDYLSNLRHILMTKEEKSRVKLYHGLYTENEKHQREIVPIFSINVGNRKKERYKFLTYDSNEGLIPIYGREIRARIDNGTYNIIPNRVNQNPMKNQNSINEITYSITKEEEYLKEMEKSEQENNSAESVNSEKDEYIKQKFEEIKNENKLDIEKIKERIKQEEALKKFKEIKSENELDIEKIKQSVAESQNNSNKIKEEKEFNIENNESEEKLASEKNQESTEEDIDVTIISPTSISMIALLKKLEDKKMEDKKNEDRSR